MGHDPDDYLTVQHTYIGTLKLDKKKRRRDNHEIRCIHWWHLSLCNWFVRLAYINILWILFSLAGLIIFGFFPATVAMLATLRQYLQKNDPPVFKTFWNYYKTEFFASNKLGAISVVIGFILFININFLQSTSRKLSEILYYPIIIHKLHLLLAICYLLASYVDLNKN